MGKSSNGELNMDYLKFVMGKSSNGKLNMVDLLACFRYEYYYDSRIMILNSIYILNVYTKVM